MYVITHACSTGRNGSQHIQQGKQQVTIRQVAEKAGVSQMTVSRVLNHQGRVKEKTREKVQKAIDELNYRPNLSARRLAGGKSLLLGLVYYNPSPGYMTKVLVGALNACRDKGHHLVLEDLGQRAPYAEPVKTAQLMRNVGLDGVIITPPLSNNQTFVSALEDLGIAVVKISPDDIHSNDLRVAIDDADAVGKMLDYIHSLGHRKISFIKGPPDHPSSHHRYEGYVKFLKSNDIRLRPDYVVQGDYTYRSGIQAGHMLLRLQDPPTIILAGNDDMAAGAVTAAHMQGIKVPQELSVAGFDDTEIATNIWPELTTVKQPISEMSKRAIDLLAAHIYNDHQAVDKHRELMDYELMFRQSVAPPKSSE